MPSKKAILTIELGYESAQTSNLQIEEDILKEAQIPWCRKISKIEIQQPPNPAENSAGLLVCCPVCGRRVSEPVRGIDAPNFKIDDYKCECVKRFRILS